MRQLNEKKLQKLVNQLDKLNSELTDLSVDAYFSKDRGIYGASIDLENKSQELMRAIYQSFGISPEYKNK